MSKAQKSKARFRKSAKWRKFRAFMKKKQSGLDPITQKPLYKGANLHHRFVSANTEQYEDLTNIEDYIMLNKKTHDMLHFIYNYWRNDPDILQRIEEELQRWH